MTPEEWAAQWLKLEGTHTPSREYLLAGTFRAAIAEEREACAKEADKVVDPVDSPLTALSSEAARMIAAAIRARP